MSDDFNPENVVARLRDLFKSDQPVGSATRKPPGPWGAKKEEAGPASLPGLAAPGNVPGPGRGKGKAGKAKRPTSFALEHAAKAAAAAAPTIPANAIGETPVTDPHAKTLPKAAGGAAPREFLYVSKKDFPQAPNGTVDSTPNSWKVPAGIGRQLQAKLGEAPPEPPTTEQQAAGFGKQKNAPETIKTHLKFGDIASSTRFGEGNISETYKVVIQGNGAGVMKPVVTNYFVPSRQLFRTDPPSDQRQGLKYDYENFVYYKETVKVLEPYEAKFVGCGAGNLPYRKQPQREVAGYQVAQLHGLDNAPVTVMRAENGVTHSVQEFKDGLKTITDVRKNNQFGPATSEIEILRSLVPKEKQAELEQKIMDLAVNDIIINNNDRHGHNYLIDPSNGDITLIDHGLAFGNSMHGNRNHFLHNVFHKNTPIKMSETMKTRLSNLSYGDYKRAKPGMKDWEAGQDFLRNRYVLALQEREGEIDRQKFLHTQGSNDGTAHEPGDTGNWGFAGANYMKIESEFKNREQARMLPHQMFESWAKAYLRKAAGTPSHRDHEDAKVLRELGVFMERGYCAHPGGEEAYRAEGRHKEYEKFVPAIHTIPQNIPELMKTWKQKKKDEELAALDAKYGVK